jgi:hypothetical protein
VLLGGETGGRTAASISRVQPESGSQEVRQETSFELTAVQYLGAQWQAFRWSRPDAGRGAFGFASAAAEVPLQRWLALQAELRHQVGSATMSADYDTFDHIDLGGTRFSVGARFSPWFAR